MLSIVRLALAALACSAPVSFVRAQGDTLDREQLAKLLGHDNHKVIEAFVAHPSQVLPFVDSYLEGGLKRLEKEGEGARDAMNVMFSVGVSFATLADTAFNTKGFETYAKAFSGWNAEQQKSFREGQTLYREGMAAAQKDTEVALASLQRSRELAAGLRDLWGEAMAALAIAELRSKSANTAHIQEAKSSAERAADVYFELRQIEEATSAYRLRAALERAGKDADPARVVAWLKKAWEGPLAQPGVDPALGRAVGAELATELSKSSDAASKEMLELLRRSIEHRFPAPKENAPPRK